MLDCLRLATQAPNASNAQTWRWLVVTDTAVKSELGALYRAHLAPPMEALLAQRLADGDDAGVRHSRSVLHLGEVFGRVPAIVVPCFAGRLEDDWSLDRATGLLGSIYPAVWSFQLALRSRGMGSTFTTAHVLFEDEVRDAARCAADPHRRLHAARRVHEGHRLHARAAASGRRGHVRRPLGHASMNPKEGEPVTEQRVAFVTGASRGIGRGLRVAPRSCRVRRGRSRRAP